MAPVQCIDDLYAVLQISNTATMVDIRQSYRRLAMVYHPDKNKAPNAKAQFQLAYETLSDDGSRRQYDLIWPGIRKAQHTNASPETKTPFSDGTSPQHHPTAESASAKAQDFQPSQQRLDLLKRRNYQADIVAESVRKASRIEEEIATLEAENAKADSSRGTTWWAWIGVAASETTEEKERRDAARLNRMAAIRIRSSRLADARSQTKRQQDILRDIERELAVEDQKEEARKRQIREEQLRRQREQERQQADAWAEQARQMWEAQVRAEEEQRKRDEAARQEEAQRWAKRREAQREFDEALRQKEAELLAEQRQQQQARNKMKRERAARSRNHQRSSGKSNQQCRHQGWWKRVEGRHTCTECQASQPLFILQCPRCDMTACAQCRPILQNGSK